MPSIKDYGVGVNIGGGGFNDEYVPPSAYEGLSPEERWRKITQRDLDADQEYLRRINSGQLDEFLKTPELKAEKIKFLESRIAQTNANLAAPFTSPYKGLEDRIAGFIDPFVNPTDQFRQSDLYKSTFAGTAPRIQNPLAPATTPNVQMPQVNKAPVNTANLTQAYQNQITTPTNPAIQLPQQFQQNFNVSPSTYAPSANQGIKMPDFKKNTGFGSNWSDLFSVANNRYTR